MKRTLLAILFGVAVVLGACGSEEEGEAEVIENQADSNESTSEVSTEEDVEETNSDTTEEETPEDSGELTSDKGTYNIVKSTEGAATLEVEGVTVEVVNAYLAEFTPDDPGRPSFVDSVREDGTINVFVTELLVENGEDEYVEFSPHRGDVFVGGSKPYGRQRDLFDGDSEISAGSSETYVTAYYLEDENDLNAITEVRSVLGPIKTADGQLGEKFEITVMFE